MKPTLWSLSYSPWSDRARWALDHCNVDYQRRAYQPLFGEPAMRVKTGNWTRPVSVPVLETPSGALTDSLDISRWADREHGTSLFPAGHDATIHRMHALSEAALSAGRVLGLRRILEDDREALDAFVPKPLEAVLGTGGRHLAAAGLRRTIRKYAAVTPDEPEETLLEFLGVLADALRSGTTHDDKPTTLLEQFSYADLTMAVGLSFILPPHSHLRLGDASRHAYTWVDLPPGYDDLFAWRDALFERRP